MKQEGLHNHLYVRYMFVLIMIHKHLECNLLGMIFYLVQIVGQ